MVDVAQWLEHWIVVPGVVGSIPIFHPKTDSVTTESVFSFIPMRIGHDTYARACRVALSDRVIIKRDCAVILLGTVSFIIQFAGLSLFILFAGDVRLPYHAFVFGTVEELNLFIVALAGSAQ